MRSMSAGRRRREDSVVVFAEDLLQQVQGFDIKVGWVRRGQRVEGFAVGFASQSRARSPPTGCDPAHAPRLLEKEVLEVGHHMSGVPTTMHLIGTPETRIRGSTVGFPTGSRPGRGRRGSGRRRQLGWCQGRPCRESGASSPVSIFRSVVFPTPFGPTKATRSPRSTRRSKPSTMVLSP